MRPADPEWPFNVSAPDAVLERLRQLADGLPTDADRMRLATAWAETITRLRTEPRTEGEPRCFLAGLELEMRITVAPPLILSFGVYAHLNIVFLQAVALLGR